MRWTAALVAVVALPPRLLVVSIKTILLSKSIDLVHVQLEILRAVSIE
jgi:hypothetical protein